MTVTSREEFVSESIKPCGVGDTARMACGEPGLPAEFAWRKAIYRVGNVLETWKESGPCTHGGSERYLRRHWYRLAMEDGAVWTIYFDRQPRRSRSRLNRWWLYTRLSAP